MYLFFLHAALSPCCKKKEHSILSLQIFSISRCQTYMRCYRGEEAFSLKKVFKSPSKSFLGLLAILLSVCVCVFALHSFWNMFYFWKVSLYQQHTPADEKKKSKIPAFPSSSSQIKRGGVGEFK